MIDALRPLTLAETSAGAGMTETVAEKDLRRYAVRKSADRVGAIIGEAVKDIAKQHPDLHFDSYQRPAYPTFLLVDALACMVLEARGR